MNVQTDTNNDLQDRKSRLDRCLARRFRFECIAGELAILVLVIAGLSTIMSSTDTGSLISGVGFLLVAAGLILVLARVIRTLKNRFADNRNAATWAQYVSVLSDERELLLNAWQWYVAPLLPGFVLIYAGMTYRPNPNWIVIVTASLLTIGVLGLIAMQNRRAAKDMDQEIQEVRSARGL